jgi:hypothetical protein
VRSVTDRQLPALKWIAKEFFHKRTIRRVGRLLSLRHLIADETQL